MPQFASLQALVNYFVSILKNRGFRVDLNEHPTSYVIISTPDDDDDTFYTHYQILKTKEQEVLRLASANWYNMQQAGVVNENFTFEDFVTELFSLEFEV